MALNFLGLGFSFGARDDGLGKTLKGLASDFASIGKEILSLQRLQTFLQALTFDRLDDLSNKIKEIGVGGLNLTSSLESTFKQSSVEARKFGANVGVASKDLGKFTAKSASMAYNLGIGAEEAAKSIRGFDYLKGTLKKVGIASEESFAKLAAVTGIDTQKFGYDLSQVQKNLGLSDDSLASILSSARLYGDEVGSVGDGLNSIFTDLTPLLKTQKQVFKKSDAELAAYGQSFFVLSKQMQKAGVDGKEFTKNLASALNKAGGSIGQVMAGVGGDLDGLYKELVTTFGVTQEEAVAMTKMDPAQFVGQITSRVDALAASGKDISPALDFMKNRLGEAFGPEIMEQFAIVMGDTKLRAELNAKAIGKATTEAAQKTSDALGEVQKKGWESQYTAAQQFERLQEQFVANLRKKSSMSTAEFMKSARASFNDFNKFLDDTIAKGGFGKKVVQTFADVEKYGLLGLAPKNLVGELSMAGSAVEKLASPLAKLRAAGVNLLTPMGALTAAVGGLGLEFLSLRKEAKADLIGKLVKKGMTKKQAEEAVGGPLGLATQVAVERLFKELRAAFDKASAFVTGLWEGLFGNNKVDPNGSNSSKLGQKIGIFVREALQKAVVFVIDYTKKWWKDVTDIWANPDMTFAEKLKATFKRSFGMIAVVVAVALSPIGTVVAGAIGALGSLVSFLGIALLPILAVGAVLFASFRKEGETFGETWSRFVNDFVPPAWEAFKEELIGLDQEALKPLKESWELLRGVIVDVFGDMASSIGQTEGSAKGFGSFLGKTFRKIVVWTAKGIALLIDAVSATIYGFKALYYTTKATWNFISGAFMKGAVTIGYYAKTVWTRLKETGSVIGAFFSNLGKRFSARTDFFVQWFKTAAENVGIFGHNFKQAFENIWSYVSDTTYNVWGKLTSGMDGFVYSFKSAFIDLKVWLYRTWSALGDMLAAPFHALFRMMSEGGKTAIQTLINNPTVAKALGLDTDFSTKKPADEAKYYSKKYDSGNTYWFKKGTSSDIIDAWETMNALAQGHTTADLAARQRAAASDIDAYAKSLRTGLGNAPAAFVPRKTDFDIRKGMLDLKDLPSYKAPTLENVQYSDQSSLQRDYDALMTQYAKQTEAFTELTAKLKSAEQIKAETRLRDSAQVLADVTAAASKTSTTTTATARAVVPPTPSLTSPSTDSAATLAAPLNSLSTSLHSPAWVKGDLVPQIEALIKAQNDGTAKIVEALKAKGVIKAGSSSVQ